MDLNWTGAGKGGNAWPMWDLGDEGGLWGLVVPLNRHMGSRAWKREAMSWWLWESGRSGLTLLQVPCLSFPRCDSCTLCPKGCVHHS